MAKDLFNRYIWLVDTIYRAERITLEEINRRWLRNEMSGGEEIPLRTFHNHRKAIESMFDINIDCDKRNGYVYYIDNKDDMERGGIRSWLLNTFAVNNLINESHHLKRQILFEEIPSGQRFLAPIIEAMRDRVNIEITYQSFWQAQASTFVVTPYAIKVFKQRWYLLARNNFGELRTYGLDRIQELKTTDQTYTLPDDFDAKDFFDDYFGIITGIETPCVVEMKVYGQQREYLRSLPLHHSQQEKKTTDKYSVFSYYVAPTFDLQQELLSHGDTIEVLSPEELRKEIAASAVAMNKMYR